jgi:hypothetical protein
MYKTKNFEANASNFLVFSLTRANLSDLKLVEVL